MAGTRRLRHGASQGVRKRRLRSRNLERLGLRLRHRTHRHAPLRDQRHPVVLRERCPFPPAVLTGWGRLVLTSCWNAPSFATRLFFSAVDSAQSARHLATNTQEGGPTISKVGNGGPPINKPWQPDV